MVQPPTCDPESGLPPGLSDEGRAFAIVTQSDESEETPEVDDSEAEWLAKPFVPSGKVKRTSPSTPIVRDSRSGALATLGDLLK